MFSTKIHRASPRDHGFPLVRLVAAACCLAMAGGCSKTPETTALSGTVTFDGEPVAEGQLELEPRGAGRMAFAVITNGKYATPKERGVRPGSYLARITASRPTGKAADSSSFITDAASAVIREQFLPAKYNTASELEFEVAPGETMVHDFELTSN